MTATAQRQAVRTEGPTAGTRTQSTEGTATLVRFVLRRDRVRIAVWVAGIAALVVFSAASVVNLYDTPESRASYAELSSGNPAIVVMAGPGYGLDQDPTVGAIVMNEAALWTIVAVALLAVFMVVRHTRAEEESGRAELVRSTPVGRQAPALAALVATALILVVVGAVCAVGLMALGLDATGSVAFGLSLVGAGLAFAGVSLVTAQVASTARAAIGLSLVVLLVVYVLRAVGDVAGNWLTWLSPIGWAQGTRSFAGERWTALLVPLVATAVLVVVAERLAERRDFGAGLLAQRTGPARAGAGLSSPLGLAVRLQRGAVAAWVAGVATLGVFYGIVADEAEQMLADNPDLQELFAQLGQVPITDAFLGVASLIVGLLAGGFAVASGLRLHGEEAAGRADALLATPTSRARWAMSHITVMVAGTVVLAGVGGTATGIGAAIVLGDAGRVPQLAGAGLGVASAATTLGALGLVVWAARPRWSPLAWLPVVVAAVVGLLGDVLDLPGWARGLSPFHHVAAVPAEAFRWVPVVVLGGMTVALIATGLALLARRDINAT